MTATTDEELLRRRARDLARPLDAEDVGDTRQMMRFRLGGDGYAVPLDRAREVVALAGAARLPRPAWPLVALTSVAGHIVPIVMPGRSMPGQGLPPDTTWGVAVEAGGTTVCFPADVVTGVVDLREVDVSADGAGDGRRFSRGITRDGDIVIDVDGLVASVEGRQPDGRSGAAGPQDDVRDNG